MVDVNYGRCASAAITTVAKQTTLNSILAGKVILQNADTCMKYSIRPEFLVKVFVFQDSQKKLSCKNLQQKWI